MRGINRYFNFMFIPFIAVFIVARRQDLDKVLGSFLLV